MTQPLDSALRGSLHDCSGTCSAAIPGHGLSLMQIRLASATPSRWVDAVVLSVSPAGWLEVALLDDDSTTLLWNHTDLTGAVTPGDPVAIHPVYDVLAAGDTKHNVLRVGSL